MPSKVETAPKYETYCGAFRKVSNRGNHGGKTREKCKLPAGFGTKHPGRGKCRYHGGNSPAHNAKAAREQAVFMGAPVDINPLDAIIWCIKITAGEIEWLSNQIADLTDRKDDWYEYAVVGKQMNVLVRYRAEAQDRLVNYGKTAISLGLAERAVKLAEQFGSTIARLLTGVAEDLELSAAQRKKWPDVVRKNLVLIQSSAPVSDEDRTELAALPRRASSGNK